MPSLYQNDRGCPTAIWTGPYCLSVKIFPWEDLLLVNWSEAALLIINATGRSGTTTHSGNDQFAHLSHNVNVISVYNRCQTSHTKLQFTKLRVLHHLFLSTQRYISYWIPSFTRSMNSTSVSLSRFQSHFQYGFLKSLPICSRARGHKLAKAARINRSVIGSIYIRNWRQLQNNAFLWFRASCYGIVMNGRRGHWPGLRQGIWKRAVYELLLCRHRKGSPRLSPRSRPAAARAAINVTLKFS